MSIHTPLKTLHVNAETGWGGGERQVAGLCSYLRNSGHGVTIVCPPGSKLENWCREQSFSVRNAAMRSTADLASVLRLRSIIKSENPDIVHLHTSRAHVLGSMAARLAGAKVVLVTRRNQSPVHMVFPNTRAYGSWTTAVIAVSEAVKQALVSSGVDAEKIRVIESGVEVDRFMNPPGKVNLRHQFQIPDEATVICAAATLGTHKGINHLINASAILKRQGRNIFLLITGDGPDRDKFESQARELRIPSAFLGFRDDMPNVLASCDIFAMPSLAEGLGVAVLEAMAAGKPVVASAVGGLRESVVDGETGFLVPAGDPEALADALDRLISNPETAIGFGAAGRARVQERYSMETTARRNEELYFELYKERNQPIQENQALVS